MESNIKARVCGADKFMLQQVVNDYPFESDPVFIPAGFIMGFIPVSFAGKKQDNGSCGNFNLRAGVRFKKTAASGNIDNLKFIQYPAEGPAEIMMRRMGSKRIEAIWTNMRATCV